MKQTIAFCVVAAMLGLASAHEAFAALTYSSWARGDGKTVVQFTAGSGTWTIPTGVTEVELLVVGGGGGAFNDSFQSGNGAGGLYYSGTSSLYPVTPGDIAITVGEGAIQGTGFSSLFGAQVIAYGGTKGDGYTNGGDQGGYSLNGGTTVTPGNLGMHYSPMDGNWSTGGGAGATGYKGDSQLGGAGIQISITGTALWYAGGGGGPSSYSTSTNPSAVGYSGTPGYVLGGGGSGPQNFGDPSFAGLPNTGGAGGGGWGGGGGAGGSGVVTLAYVTAVPEPSSVALGFCGALLGVAVIRSRRKA